MIEDAHRLAAGLGLSVWNEDEAGPFQATPQPGAGWRPQGRPACQPHEYVRGDTAKMLTLLHPATGQVRVKGVRNSTNAVPHAWLKQELAQVVALLRALNPTLSPDEIGAPWRRWREGFSVHFTLRAYLPPLFITLQPLWAEGRVLLILDDLVGHTTPEFVCWLTKRLCEPRHHAAVQAAGRQLAEHGRERSSASSSAAPSRGGTRAGRSRSWSGWRPRPAPGTGGRPPSSGEGRALSSGSGQAAAAWAGRLRCLHAPARGPTETERLCPCQLTH